MCHICPYLYGSGLPPGAVKHGGLRRIILLYVNQLRG